MAAKVQSNKKEKGASKAKNVKTTAKKRAPSRANRSTPFTDEQPEVSLSPVVMISEMVEPEISEGRSPAPVQRFSGESPQTIHSLSASPTRAGDVDDLDLEEDQEQLREQNPSLFTRIFGNFFGGKTKVGQPEQMLNLDCTKITEGTYEVVHVFVNPRAALGHEGLMRRSRLRLSRASIRPEGESTKWEGLPDTSVADLNPEDKVVLLRKVLTPRDCRPPMEEVLERAAHQAELWFFLSYQDCHAQYPQELCEYLGSRCRFGGDCGEEETTEEEGGTPDRTENLPVSTPTVNVVNDLPPNSIEAPFKARVPAITPVVLASPPKLCNKSQDQGDSTFKGRNRVEVVNSDAENAAPF